MKKFKVLLGKLAKVGELYDAKEYDRALAMIQEVIPDPEVSEAQVAEFQFFKAAVLDSRGDPLEALALFSALNERFPGNPRFARSVKIAIHSVMVQAQRLASQDPDSPILRDYHDLLKRVDYSPWFLAYVVARQDVQQGRGDEAKARLKALVALSPKDADYLKGAFQIALLLEDLAWQTELRAMVNALIEAQPFRLELYEVLPEVAGPDAAQTAC